MKKIIVVFLTMCMIFTLLAPVCLAAEDDGEIKVDFGDLVGTEAVTDAQEEDTRPAVTRPVRDNSGSLSDYTVLIVAVVVAVGAVVIIGVVPSIVEKNSGKPKKRK